MLTDFCKAVINSWFWSFDLVARL